MRRIQTTYSNMFSIGEPLQKGIRGIYQMKHYTCMLLYNIFTGRLIFVHVRVFNVCICHQSGYYLHWRVYLTYLNRINGQPMHICDSQEGLYGRTTTRCVYTDVLIGVWGVKLTSYKSKNHKHELVYLNMFHKIDIKISSWLTILLLLYH